MDRERRKWKERGMDASERGGREKEKRERKEKYEHPLRQFLPTPLFVL